MHETKSVDTESSELCHHVSIQKVLDFGASWISDFWMRMLVSCTENIQWELLVILTDFIMKRKI